MNLNWRSILVTLLLVLVGLAAPLSVVARWTHTHVSDTDGYLAVVTPLAKDPAIRTAVTDGVTTAVTDRVDLPGLETLVRSQTRRFVDSDAFTSVWTAANREAHRQFVGVVTGDGTGEVTVDDGTVSLNLAGVTESIKQALIDRNVPGASLIPVIDASFTIFESDHIVTLQRWFRLLDGANGPLPFLAAALIAAAVAFARARLRIATIAALCVALGMGLLAIALAVVRARYLDELPQAVSAPAAAAVFDALAAPMWSMLWGWFIAALGSAVVLAALWLGWHRFSRPRPIATSTEAAPPNQEKQ
ncbi:hypothetical protein [Gryllotalpicola protaetiae]|uniref:Uncharacterized protein n=1 Tax=Gryllotalpicola protaetiae TaxID=2419771 RepID=A0A387BJJ1_9MICO|nr:hypothetical protein [Gryllotalpicola protaetiae]AYG02324.1 hypothetical protein D7I44_01435 [Gryllotalpicola protaetiae]